MSTRTVCQATLPNKEEQDDKYKQDMLKMISGMIGGQVWRQRDEAIGFITRAWRERKGEVYFEVEYPKDEEV